MATDDHILGDHVMFYLFKAEACLHTSVYKYMYGNNMDGHPHQYILGWNFF